MSQTPGDKKFWVYYGAGVGEGGVTVLLGGFVHKLGGDQVEVGVHWEMPEGGFPENFPCLGATGWSIPPQC